MRVNRQALRLTRAATPSVAGTERAAAFVITLLLVVTPLLVIRDAKESFRLVQGLASGWFGLASLALAALSLRDTGPVRLAALWRRPAVQALAPLLVVVAGGGFVTAHPTHFRAAFADFAIGVACVIGWSLAFDARTLRRLLVWTILPAVLVAALGLDQYAGWVGLLDELRVDAPTARLRVTSTIGNPGDLASFVVLPTLVALSGCRDASRHRRLAIVAGLVVMGAIIVVTATLAAAAAVMTGAAVWWWLSTASRDRRARVPLLAAALVASVIGAVALSAPLRTRVLEKVAELTRGDVNALMTGRLDGWRAAWAMLRQAPITGVGQGGFRAEFADTRLALMDQGVTFYPEQDQVMFATPHNEALSVAAEQGLPGLSALAWAVGCLAAAAVRLRRGAAGDPDDRSRRDGADTRALAWSGVAALAPLCAVSFPLHVASVAWPWLLFLAWVFRASDTGEAGA